MSSSSKVPPVAGIVIRGGAGGKVNIINARVTDAPVGIFIEGAGEIGIDGYTARNTPTGLMIVDSGDVTLATIDIQGTDPARLAADIRAYAKAPGATTDGFKARFGRWVRLSDRVTEMIARGESLADFGERIATLVGAAL